MALKSVGDEDDDARRLTMNKTLRVPSPQRKMLKIPNQNRPQTQSKRKWPKKKRKSKHKITWLTAQT